VRLSGRTYEAMVAARAHRPRCDLFHSALEVSVDGVTTTVEMAPVWVQRGERGVVAEGPVGAQFLGRSASSATKCAAGEAVRSRMPRRLGAVRDGLHTER
jgi:hypothetical protein